ncbi:unnamed protein product [Meganyctiphanes norvegica]|uniref:Uncharacterized protein n=1 Tax=Meganyctiphanes norvegica TaxID=48144 RepID=A0AAV2RLQ8_MEGNR
MPFFKIALSTTPTARRIILNILGFLDVKALLILVCILINSSIKCKSPKPNLNKKMIVIFGLLVVKYLLINVCTFIKSSTKWKSPKSLLNKNLVVLVDASIIFVSAILCLFLFGMSSLFILYDYLKKLVIRNIYKVFKYSGTQRSSNNITNTVHGLHLPTDRQVEANQVCQVKNGSAGYVAACMAFQIHAALRSTKKWRLITAL